MKLYTKAGDEGETSLYNGEKHRKSSEYFAVLGDIDELSCFIGLALAASREAQHTAELPYAIDMELTEIQSRLLDIGSSIASPQVGSEPRAARLKFTSHLTAGLEAWMDNMDKALPPLTNFILPGGTKISAYLHVCRAIARRAERSYVALLDSVDERPDDSAAILQCLNRLSDYFFMTARFVSNKSGLEDTIYVKHA